MERKSVQGGTVFRSAGWNVWLFCCLSGMAVAMAATAASAGAGTAIVFAPIAAACLYLAVRSLRAGVLVANDGLTVRNVSRTVRVPWTRIKAIGAGSSGNITGAGKCVILELDDGKTITARGVGGFSGDVGRAAREMAEMRPA